MRKIMHHPMVLFLPVFVLCWCQTMNSQEKATPVKPETITRRLGSLIKVRPEYEERYIIIHRHVFPGVLDRIRKSNLRNYSIFARDGMLFSYFEYVGSDYDADMKAIADTTTKDWWKLTDPMQEPLPTRKEGEWWASMDPVFEAEVATVPQTDVVRLAYVAHIKPGNADAVSNYFKTEGQALLPFINQASLKNVHVYQKDGCLYMYAEYHGSDWPKDFNALKEEPGWRAWNKKLNELLVAPWQEMRIVFHTN
ncbi:MAG: L-rhamnose mutarotase [Bacteroidota bacterium]